MYEDFLETILTYIKALNAADAEIAKRTEHDFFSVSGVPQLRNILVDLDGEIVGNLVDEIDGQWSYVELPLRH